jgi:hypothetical protein
VVGNIRIPCNGPRGKKGLNQLEAIAHTHGYVVDVKNKIILAFGLNIGIITTGEPMQPEGKSRNNGHMRSNLPSDH